MSERVHSRGKAGVRNEPFVRKYIHLCAQHGRYGTLLRCANTTHSEILSDSRQKTNKTENSDRPATKLSMPTVIRIQRCCDYDSPKHNMIPDPANVKKFLNFTNATHFLFFWWDVKTFDLWADNFLKGMIFSNSKVKSFPFSQIILCMYSWDDEAVTLWALNVKNSSFRFDGWSFSLWLMWRTPDWQQDDDVALP